MEMKLSDRDLQVRGVNLGNWLVLEKWMSPLMFEETAAEDEYRLVRELSEEVYRERMERHRSEYITQTDFMMIKQMGCNAVRIPIPYYIFGDRPPYIGCIEYLDRAFDWAEEYGLQILIDLHTVPGSQNGFDNGGICGVCCWAEQPDEVEFVLNLLERLAQRYGHRNGLFGIQPLNEPITDVLLGDKTWKQHEAEGAYRARNAQMLEASAPIKLSFLREFYTEAYVRIRRYMPAPKYYVIHDAFMITAWKDFMQTSEYENVILDSHMYLSSLEIGGVERSLQGYGFGLDYGYGRRITEMSEYFPVICGEWCLSNEYAKTLPDGVQKDAFYQELAKLSMKTWSKGAGGFYWSYKLITSESDLDAWDIRKCVLRGWLPSAF